MHRTLLLCFVHGFKGDDDTFGGFPEHLRALASYALPKITVKAVTYPKYETRGDLKECVGRFREWLQNKVIDLEVAASTPSPTIDPSVHTILIGHSMGGIVAAETLLAIASDSPIPSQKNPLPSMASQTVPGSQPPPTGSEGPTFMFPYIQGILAFDTPYLGISPGVVAHGAEQHYRTVTGAYSALADVAGVFGYGASRKDTSPKRQQDNQKLLTQGADAMSASITNASSDAAAVPAWQKWGKYAMFAGAAGAVAAGGAAAYLKRDTITEGWSFIGSHLEFVGCLARGEELRSRLERIVTLNKDRNIGFADVITVLGKGAVGDKKSGTTVPNTGGFVEIGSVDGIAPSERTFCTVPKGEKNKQYFEKAKNDKARDEMHAHMTMFTARENSGYFTLGERSRDLIVQWVRPEASEWYRESEPEGGIKKIPHASRGDENDHGPTLPKWINEYHNCLTSPHRRENRAAIAISALETDKGAGNVMTPRRPDVRPPRLDPPTRELAIGKANGRDEEVGATRPTPPQTPPRRRPPKLGRPKAELECMKRTKFDDESRSATPDSPHDARRSQSRQPKADIESNEGGDGGATPEGPHRRPPKLGHPKAETINMVLERKRVNAKLSTINTKLQSAERETRKQAPELDSGKAETSTMAPERGSAKIETSTTALVLKDDEVETNTTTPRPNSPQGDARKAIPETNHTKAEITPALPESKSARAEPDGTSSDRSKAPDLKIEEAGGAVPDGPPSRLPKLGRPKAEIEYHGHSAEPKTSVTTVQPNRGPAETSVTASNPSRAPGLQTGEVGGAKPEGPRPRPRPKPPKLGRPKPEIDSQKPGKLPKEDERVKLKMPYTEHTKLGRTGAEPEPNETKSEQAPNEMDQEARDVTLEGSPPEMEGRSNHVKDGIPRELPTRPPKLGKPKAEPETTKLSNPAKKDVGAQESTSGKLKKAEPESKMIHFKQAPRDIDEVDKVPIEEASPRLEPTEIESTGSHAMDTEPPAVGTKPLKLGRPKAESEPTKPSKLTKNGKGAGNFTPAKPTKAKIGFKQIKPEQTPRPTKDAIPPTGRARPPKPEKPKVEIESTELSYLTQKR